MQTPTTAEPTTLPPTTSTPTTASPTTTTPAPTIGTTAAPTTTTTVATTTTTGATTTTTTAAPVGDVYYLKNDGVGDSAALFFKELAQDAPDNQTLPNYDTDADGVPGLSLAPTASGWGESDSSQMQRFGLGASGDHLNGPIRLTLYVAVPDGGAPADIDIALSYCDGITWAIFCTNLAIATATITSEVSDGFQEVIIDWDAIDFTLGFLQPDLVLRITTDGAQTLHTGFDSDDTPSRIEMTVIPN